MALTSRAEKRGVDGAVRAFRAVIERMPAAQVEQLRVTLDGLTRDDPAPAPPLATLEGAIGPAAAEFAVRQRLLAGSLTSPEVARRLGVSRQTPHDRVRAGTLLAVLDRGVWRYPAWQFDPAGPNGVLPGFPETIKALGDMPALSKIGWMIAPKALLPDTPLALLRRGGAAERRAVLLAAETAGRL